jgi:hypothetical protein
VIAAAAAGLADAPVWGLSAAELAALIVEVEAVSARLAGVGLSLAREADRRGLGVELGAASTADWLRDRLRLTPGEAKARLDLAARLDPAPTAVAAAGRVLASADAAGASRHRAGYPDPPAGAAGRTGTDHTGTGHTGTVDATSDTGSGHTGSGHSGADHPGPGDTGAAARLTGLGVDADALTGLAGCARRHLPCTATALRGGRIGPDHAHVVRRVMHRLPHGIDETVWAQCEAFLTVQATRLDPRSLARLGAHLTATLRFAADTDEAAAAERREQRTHHGTMFGLVDNGDGTMRAYGTFAYEDADTITTALAPLSAPAPAADGTPDPRSHTTRTGHALVELARRALDNADLPSARGARPHIVVTATLPTLLDRPGAPAATTGWDTPLTPTQARRIACDAGITRVLTDPAGLPLDVGREKRTVTPAQWIALTQRDKGCTFPGCTRPSPWCQAHHILHWADGGPTTLDNQVLLCGHHHRVIHHHGWAVHLATDGHPEYTPPAWIDPHQRPRRNTHHHIATNLAAINAKDPPPHHHAASHPPQLEVQRRAPGSRAGRRDPGPAAASRTATVVTDAPGRVG